jgi:hypothetical protein
MNEHPGSNRWNMKKDPPRLNARTEGARQKDRQRVRQERPAGGMTRARMPRPVGR